MINDTSTMRSHVREVVDQYRPEMTQQEMSDFVISIKRALVEDEQQMRATISDMKESMIADLTARDQRDARLQHYMSAHNVPLDKHMSSYIRDIENLNNLYRETFGCPRTYSKGREIVEHTTLFQRMSNPQQ